MTVASGQTLHDVIEGAGDRRRWDELKRMHLQVRVSVNERLDPRRPHNGRPPVASHPVRERFVEAHNEQAWATLRYKSTRIHDKDVAPITKVVQFSERGSQIFTVPRCRPTRDVL